MITLLNNLKIALKNKVISEQQALYVIYKHSGLEYKKISAKKLLELTKLKYIVGNRVGPELYKDEGAIQRSLAGTIEPKYSSELSREVVLYLCKILCNKDKKTGLIKIPGSSSGDSVSDVANAYLGGEGLIAYHYLIFLFLFPVKGATNKRWEKHFTSIEYTSVRLRINSISSARKFKTIARDKDMGAFLLGTYLFMKDSIIGNKTFIKSIKNYLKEYHVWYEEAEQIIKESDNIKQIFNNSVSQENRLNIAL